MDDTTLLCERCGYTLEGLPSGGTCPECGMAIVESLPAARPGSPWQLHRSARTWLTTNLGTLRDPRDRFRRGIAEMRWSWRLMWVNCHAASLVTVLPWSGTLIGDPSRGATGLFGALQVITVTFIASATIGMLFLLLCAVEYAGIRFFAARRRWRLSRAAASQVCGHASIGWMVGPLFSFAALAIYYTLARFFDVVPRGTVRLALGRAFDYGRVGWDQLVQTAIIAGSYLIGLLVFELLVYAGVRECRFANSPNPASAPHGPAPSPAGPTA